MDGRHGRHHLHLLCGTCLIGARLESQGLRIRLKGKERGTTNHPIEIKFCIGALMLILKLQPLGEHAGHTHGHGGHKAFEQCTTGTTCTYIE